MVGYTGCVMRITIFAGFFLLCGVMVVLSFFGVVYAHGDEEHDTLPSEVSVCHSLSEGERRACYISICEDIPVANVNEPHSDICAEDIIDAAMVGSGPKFANAVLADLVGNSWFSFDEYVLAQRIGTALLNYGVTGSSFLQCSSDFRYGCYYGFFTGAMSTYADSPVETAIAVCDSIPDVSLRGNCYHIMGHMFMKHSEHDITPALSLCDSLQDQFQSDCWDGVFMENIHYALAMDIVFDETDILAPCRQIGDQYRPLCYGNHGSYILQSFNRYDFDFADPAGVCLGAEGYVAVCEHSVQDAASGAHSHHTHSVVRMDEGYSRGSMNDGEMLHHQKSRSWFQRLIDFVVGLFAWGGEESVDDDVIAAQVRTEKVVADAAAARARQASLGTVSHSFPDGVVPADVVYAVTIVYADGVYTPDVVHIRKGERVLWVNEDQVFWPAANLHPTHKQYPGSNIMKCGTDERVMLFDACEAMGPGAVYSFVFNEVGEWKFHDHINPRATGVVVVGE